jgi:hypothetical protein
MYCIYELSAFNTIDNTLTGSNILYLTPGAQLILKAACTATSLLDVYVDRAQISINRLY